MHKTERESKRKRGGRDGSAIHLKWLEMIAKNQRNSSNIAQKLVLKNEEECGHKDSNISLQS